MPFGLKNASATYQRMMKIALGIKSRNVQVYINYVVITTREEATLIGDLGETFDNLDR
jgi:predicted transcriptional regulator